ncbi:succinylglutamate desuccinylase/aspartoacylase family protein [Sphingomonas sediminicola]|uniref:Succinylglutamate desuccinylase/aspartoacylase family protein n=1 Tax=Sphingomonas sediminicola TaxID=386874 RepID=A0ABX6TAM0_9SPHN|nr:succinylglutamate desuccinylase/aspartoacylase family protein [Sphingomonas sediminicola]
MARTTGLAILDALPDGFLDCHARDLHQVLDGPTLIELAGERGSPLFVSILLHGNEDSGLGAIQRVMNGYRGRVLPRSLMLLIGNVEAARHGLRRLDDQPDYNRIWPGTPNQGDTPEAGMMAKVHARALARHAVAAIDLHNNTGRNPHYAVVCNFDPPTLGLAALFSRRAVCFRGILGSQTASFAGLIPAITAECGLPGEAANAQAGARFLDEALNLDELPNGANERIMLELYHTLGVVRVREDVSFGFGVGEAEVRFDPALDKNNFRELKPGTVLGETRHQMPLQMIDERGLDVAAHYFETSGGKLKLRKQAVPAMLTVVPRIVRQDCFCYLMERL